MAIFSSDGDGGGFRDSLTPKDFNATMDRLNAEALSKLPITVEESIAVISIPPDRDERGDALRTIELLARNKGFTVEYTESLDQARVNAAALKAAGVELSPTQRSSGSLPTR